jgi:hypothetical protein
MELFIRLIGNNITGYLFAGAGALLGAILHKAANLLILYGADVIRIYSNLFEFLKKQANMPGVSPPDLITGIILVYISIGSLAALAGYFFGRYSLRMQLERPAIPLSDDPFASAWSRTDPSQPFRIVLLAAHLLCLPGMLILINHYGLKPVSVIPVLLYIFLSILYYKRILARMKKPFFWSQLIIMTLAAGLFWNPSGSTQGNLSNGFLAGLEMSLRAVFIISAFSGLSVEIRNPRITKSLLTYGLGNAYAAVSLTFNSLPVMLERSARLKTFFTRPFRSFSNLLYEAELWLKCYQAHLDI